jgi:hypothetical protein
MYIKQEIKKYAEAMRKVYCPKELDFRSVYKDLGGFIEKKDILSEPNNNSMIIRTTDDDLENRLFGVELRANLNSRTKNLLLGIELGFLFMYLHYIDENYNINPQKYSRYLQLKKISAPQEIEDATIFALNFIAPIDEFRIVLEKYNSDLEKIAEYFNLERFFLDKHGSDAGLFSLRLNS